MTLQERSNDEAQGVSRRRFAKMAAAAAVALGAGALSLGDADARGEPDGPAHRRRERLSNRRDRRRNLRDRRNRRERRDHHGPNHQ